MPPPSSHYFHIEESHLTGRRIHASVDIPANTPLLTTDNLSTYIIFREYRREVCHWCFAYDGGRKLKVWEAQAGLAWCSEECRASWVEHWDGDIALEIWKQIEKLVQKSGSKSQKAESITQGMDKGTGAGAEKDAHPHTPNLEVIDARWTKAENQADLMMACLNATESSTKAGLHAMSQARAKPTDPTTVLHLVSGVLLSAKRPCLWSSMLELYATEEPYSSLEDLDLHTCSYHHLLIQLASFSKSLRQHITPDTIRAVPSRDGPNSFGIRSLDDAGDEIFGYGVWPEASYWNHNCRPNMQKRRVNRTWEFWTSKEVKKGEELCITYLGGDEKTLNVEERRARLMKTWGFQCGCGKCVEEGGE